MKIKFTLPHYFRYLKAIGRSDRTIKNASYDLNQFIRFLEEENIFAVDELTSDIILEYQQELAFRVTRKGTLLSLRSQAQLLGSLKVYTRFLKEYDYLPDDPADKLKLPKKPKKLPKVILSKQDVKTLFEAIDTRTITGYRNRVIIEILYDTAVRRAEITSMKLHDMDLNAGFIHVTGKGNKDRVVPLSERVCVLVKSYILHVRPMFIKDKNEKDHGHLVLNRWGTKMSGNSIREVVKRVCLLAGIKKPITTHTFRHTCVTHMLRNGAPVRHLQQMLGHESLESTQVYTHVTINDLKKVHAKYHPGDTLSTS